MPSSPSKILAIDFDRVLHDVDHPLTGKRMGAPLPGAVEACQELADRGFELVCFTIRGAKAHIYKWLEYYDFPPMEVTNVKPDALVFVDDRAYRHVAWDDTIRAIYELTGVERDE
jgi:hypothetical protein